MDLDEEIEIIIDEEAEGNEDVHLNFEVTENETLNCRTTIAKQIRNHIAIPENSPTFIKIRNIIMGGGLAYLTGPKGSGKTGFLKRAIQSIEKCEDGLKHKVVLAETFAEFGLTVAKTLINLAQRILILSSLDITLDKKRNESSARGALENVISKIHKQNMSIQNQRTDNAKHIKTFFHVVIMYYTSKHHVANQRETVVYYLSEIAIKFKESVSLIAVSSPANYMSFDKRIRSRLQETIICNYLQEYEEVLSVIEKWLRLPGDSLYVRQWNSEIQILRTNDSFKAIINEIFTFTKNMFKFQTLVELALVYVDQNSPFLLIEHFQKAQEILFTDHLVNTISGLPLVDLFLLVSMAKLAKQEIKINFELAHDEYRKFIAGLGADNLLSIYDYGKSMCIGAFDNLINMKLIYLPKSRRGIDEKLFSEISMGVTYQQLDTALNISNQPTILNQFLTSLVS